MRASLFLSLPGTSSSHPTVSSIDHPMTSFPNEGQEEEEEERVFAGGIVMVVAVALTKGS